MTSVAFEDVKAAAVRIAGAVERTPILHSRTLSHLTRAEVWLKFENLQFTGSFKERGALNKLLSLREEERRRGVIAMSAGNHAQGVAYHAARLGVRAVIVMPRGTPNSKVANPQVTGADVVLEGDSLADPALHARTSRAKPCDAPEFITTRPSAKVPEPPGAATLEVKTFASGPRPATVPLTAKRSRSAARAPSRRTSRTRNVCAPCSGASPRAWGRSSGPRAAGRAPFR